LVVLTIHKSCLCYASRAIIGLVNVITSLFVNFRVKVNGMVRCNCL